MISKAEEERFERESFEIRRELVRAFRELTSDWRLSKATFIDSGPIFVPGVELVGHDGLPLALVSAHAGGTTAIVGVGLDYVDCEGKTPAEQIAEAAILVEAEYRRRQASTST